MSRFFELLDETSRSDLDTSAVADAPILPLPRGATTPTLVDMEKALSTSLRTDPQPPSSDQLFGSGDVGSTYGIRATQVEISINSRDRLLPNVSGPAIMEHYRRLRTSIVQQQKVKAFRTLLVTSPNPQEGKTLTVLNLGLSFAMLPSFKVLVLDGDLRRGTVGKTLGVHGRPGFSNLLDGSAQLEDVVLRSDDSPLHFVVSGTSAVSPGELLQSEELPKQLRRISEEFSLVLVDSPPANLIADVQLLAGGCDAVLLVARAFSTTKKDFEKTIQDVSAFRVIGTVLNGAAGTHAYGKYRGYH